MFDGERLARNERDAFKQLIAVHVKIVNLPEDSQPDDLSNEEIKKLQS